MKGGENKMATEILCALIGIFGVVIGAVISFCLQLLLTKKQYKQQIKFEHFKLKQELFPKIIKYISILAKLENTTNFEEKRKILNIENKEYNDFYFSLSLIATEDLLQQFNELRNKIQNEKLSQSQAVQEITRLLRSI